MCYFQTTAKILMFTFISQVVLGAIGLQKSLKLVLVPWMKTMGITPLNSKIPPIILHSGHWEVYTVSPGEILW